MSTATSPALVLFADAAGELPRLFTEAGVRVMTLPLTALGAFGPDGRPIDAVAVDLRGGSRLPDELVGLRRRHPKLPVMLVMASLAPDVILEAMRAGITECVTEPLNTTVVAEAIARLTVPPMPESTGQLFAFIGAKGGIGTTTTAVNVASALAETKARTLFIDLHVAYGDAAIFFGVEPRFSIVDALENIHRLDDSVFRTLVVQTASGVDLLASSHQGVVWSVDSAKVKRLLEFALARYQYVVVDCARADAAVLDALEATTKIVLVATQDLAALRSGSRMAATLRQRYRTDRVTVAVARYDSVSDIGRDDIERVVGSPVRYVLPSDYRTSLAALNRGLPLIVNNHTKLASAFKSLSRDLAGLVEAQKPEPRVSLFGRLAGKR